MFTIFYMSISCLVVLTLSYIFLEKYNKEGLDKFYIGLIIFFMILSAFFVLTDQDNGALNWPYYRHEGFMVTAFAMCLVYLARKK
jgi:hypothetical protein